MAIEERRTRRTLAERLSVTVPLAVVWTIGCVIMALVAAQPATRSAEMLMDPAFTLGAKWYTGLISNLGILTWTVGAAAAFAGAWLCRLGGRKRALKFLLTGGIVGTVLLADDLFMFHAVFLPAEVGIPKIVGQALLGMAALLWLVTQRHEIQRTHFYLLAASVIGLAVSYAVDTVHAPLPGDGWNVVEDGAKFLGVLAWATYFVITTRDISRSVFVDALLTWPDAAYQKVYDDLRVEQAVQGARTAPSATAVGRTPATAGAASAAITPTPASPGAAPAPAPKSSAPSQPSAPAPAATTLPKAVRMPASEAPPAARSFDPLTDR